MRFIVPINDPAKGESQTLHSVETHSDCPKTNKRKMKEYFVAQGVPEQHTKRVMKAMGFWGDALRGGHNAA